MSDRFKPVLFVIVLVLISNWAAGLISDSRSHKRTKQKTKDNATNAFSSCQDNLSLKGRNPCSK